MARLIKRADNITLGVPYHHVVDRVKEVPYKDSFQIHFRTGVNIKGKEAKGNKQYIYCTVDCPLSELQMKDGDGVVFTKIRQVSFSKYMGQMTVFMNVEVEVYPGVSSVEYMEGGYPVVEEEAYSPPEDEGVPQ